MRRAMGRSRTARTFFSVYRMRETVYKKELKGALVNV